MIWDRLKRNQCPKCPTARTLDFFDKDARVVGCSSCGFRVTEDMFGKIVAQRVEKMLGERDGGEDTRELAFDI